MKILLSVLLIFLTLHSRENPFFPADSLEDMPITSNKTEKYTPLNRAAISLPDYARVLEEVTIKYKNLDGSIESKSIKVNRSVDWHIPLFISQTYMNSEDKKTNIKNKISKKIGFKFINFTILEKEIFINTADKLIRNFFLVNPHKIVLDFKREANFLTYKKKLSTIPFTLLHVGNHDGYYRVVITLDGRYQYKIDSTDSGYKIKIF